MALSILFPLYRYFFGKECVAWRSSCSWFEWEPAILPNSTRIESCWLVHFSIRRFWFCKCFVFFHSDCSLFVVIPSELSKTPKTETKSIFCVWRNSRYVRLWYEPHVLNTFVVCRQSNAEKMSQSCDLRPVNVRWMCTESERFWDGYRSTRVYLSDGHQIRRVRKSRCRCSSETILFHRRRWQKKNTDENSLENHEDDD